MTTTKRFLARASDRGASLVEYALLVALIAVVCIAAVTKLGEATSDSNQSAADGLEGVAAPTTGCPPGQHRGTGDSSHTRRGESEDNCYDASHEVTQLYMP